MHRQNDAAHQIHIIVRVQISNTNFAQEDFRIPKMAVVHAGVWRAVQLGPIHAVDGGDDSVKAGTEVANVPHPLEHRRNVHIGRAKAEHGEQNGQNGSNENGNLQTAKRAKKKRWK